MHFWSFSTFKNKHFVKDVFQISKVVRVQSPSPFATVSVTDFGAKFGSFWRYVSMCWQCLFFRLLFIRFGTLFGAQNEPKKGLRILREVLILVFRASDGCPESFWTPPRGHFGRFGGSFLIHFGWPGDQFCQFRDAFFKRLAIERLSNSTGCYSAFFHTDDAKSFASVCLPPPFWLRRPTI